MRALNLFWSSVYNHEDYLINFIFIVMYIYIFFFIFLRVWSIIFLLKFFTAYSLYVFVLLNINLFTYNYYKYLYYISALFTFSPINVYIGLCCVFSTRSCNTHSCHNYQSTVCYKNFAYFRYRCMYVCIYILFHLVYKVKNRLVRMRTTMVHSIVSAWVGALLAVRVSLCAHVYVCCMFVGYI